MPYLNIKIYVDPKTINKNEDAFELAKYFIDPDADDPVPTLESAQWQECGHEHPQISSGGCLDCGEIQLFKNIHDFKDGKGPVPAHQHSNGGGWVADTAYRI